MIIAVLTLTRDRLDYTKHCFAKLREFAGVEFDHLVVDQGSTDGSREWLDGEFAENRIQSLILEPENIGICPGMNRLVEHALEVEDYDVIVKIDNDCELTQPNTLRDVCELVLTMNAEYWATAEKVCGGCLLSPRILGLRQPPQPMRELAIGPEAILDVPQIGGIFLAVPAWVYDPVEGAGFRYSDNLLGDDVEICHWFRRQGGTCGYVKRLEAWHYETTDGQHERYPAYFERKYAEMGVPA